MKCENCGAPATPGAGAFCSHCGTRLPLPAAPPAPAEAPRSARFDAVEAHPRFNEAMAFRPEVSSAGQIGGLVLFVVFSVVMFMGFFGSMATRHADRTFSAIFSQDDTFSSGVALAFVGICALIIIATLVGLNRAIRYIQAPIKAMVAMVVAKRTHVRGGGNNSSATTRYHATLQFREGDRVEYTCGDELFGQIADEDMGVAYVKDKNLVGFDRFDV